MGSLGTSGESLGPGHLVSICCHLMREEEDLEENFTTDT